MNWLKRSIEKLINRRGREVLPVRLGWRRIYVLPSKPGLFFSVIWFVMLMAALNFNNNMGLMLVFLLFGMTQVMLLNTFFNMRNVTINRVKTPAVFLGDVAMSELTLKASTDRFQLVCDSESGSNEVNITQGEGHLLHHCLSQKRGWQKLPRFKIYTRYAMGLFTVWVYCQPKESFLVYPKPEKPVPEFPSHGGLDGEKELNLKGDELASVREYQVGDPVRDIAWKKTAQSDKVWVKQFEATQGKHMLFDFDQLHMASLEARLSRLTAWVLRAEHENVDYKLLLPGFNSEMTHGAAQLTLCLEALALYGGAKSPE